jgi:hypothetical protein
MIPQALHGGVAEAVLTSDGASKRPIASKARARIIMSSPTAYPNPGLTLIVMVEVGTVN